MRRLLMLPLFLFFATLLSVHDATAASCNLRTGVWSWFVNGDVTFHKGGTAEQAPTGPVYKSDGKLVKDKVKAKWSCRNGTVKIVWNFGFTDELVLSNDGKRLVGSNQGGAGVSGRWKHDAP